MYVKLHVCTVDGTVDGVHTVDDTDQIQMYSRCVVQVDGSKTE